MLSALLNEFFTRVLPAPLAGAAADVLSYLAPYAAILAGAAAVLSLVWCFFGYRLRRLRHTFGMAILGASVTAILCEIFAPFLSPLALLGLVAGGALICGIIGALLWQVGAFLSYGLSVFGLVLWGITEIFPALGLAWALVIAGLCGVGAAVLLSLVMRHSEIVFSGLSGFAAALAAVRLLEVLGFAPALSLDRTVLFLITLGVGAALSAAGIVVQYLAERPVRVRPKATPEDEARAGAAITFNDGILPELKVPEPEPEEDNREERLAQFAPAEETLEETAEEPAEETEEPAEELPEETPEETQAEPAEGPMPEVIPVPEEPAEETEESAEELPEETAEETPEEAPAEPAETPAEEDVVCPVCGGKNEPGSRFCTWCGTAL